MDIEFNHSAEEEDRYQAILTQGERIAAIANTEEARYFDDAERRISHDYVTWDEEKNQVALIGIWAALESQESDAEKIALCREEIRKLMMYAAKGHAERISE